MIFLLILCYILCSQEINDQLDCRYFGELLAELNRKTNDLYSCLLQHVEKIGGRYWPYVCYLCSAIPEILGMHSWEQSQVDSSLDNVLIFPSQSAFLWYSPLTLSHFLLSKLTEMSVSALQHGQSGIPTSLKALALLRKHLLHVNTLQLSSG